MSRAVGISRRLAVRLDPADDGGPGMMPDILHRSAGGGGLART